jgi:hypothetical protein
MDCLDGNDNDVAYCIADMEQDADVDDAYGCSDYFDDYFDCTESNASCHHDANVTSWSSGGHCDSANDRLGDCRDRASSLDDPVG